MDPEKEVLRAYDVWKERSMFGKSVMGIERSTYLIDEEGTIVKAFGKGEAERQRQADVEGALRL